MSRRILYIHTSTSARALAEASLSLTPKVSLHGDSELFIEMSGTEKLWGGEAEILFRANELISSFSTSSSIVVTDRPEWSKSLSVKKEVILPPGKSRDVFFSLPVERLEMCGDPTTLQNEQKQRKELISFMKKVGLRRIEDFVSLPSSSITKRFGKEGGILHQWARGERELLLPVFVPYEKIKESIDTDEISSLERLLFYLRQVFVRLEYRLHGRCLIAREMKLSFFLESRKQIVKQLKLAEPMRDANSLLRVLRDFLSHFQWDSPLEKLEIEISDSVPHSPGQLSFFDNTETRFQELSQFVTRLRARCGESVIGVPSFFESYFPETSWVNSWPPKTFSPPKFDFSERPLFILEPPRSYTPSKRWHLVPSEDVESEWWETKGSRRYFIAENERNERLWVYFDEKSCEWFLHGYFD